MTGRADHTPQWIAGETDQYWYPQNKQGDIGRKHKE